MNKDRILSRAGKGVCLILVAASLLLSGCFTDPYAGYLGLWEQQKTLGDPVVMEITQKEGVLLARENVFWGDTLMGQPYKPKELKKVNGKLFVPAGFADVQLVLSDDNNELHANNRTFLRIDAARLERIKTDLKKCEALKAEYGKKADAIKGRFRWDQWREKNAALAPLQKELKSRAGKISGCVAFFR